MGSEAASARQGLTHEKAAEIHAYRRLAERYNLPLESAKSKMFQHLVLILAGDVIVQGRWPRDGKELIMIPVEIDYFVIWDPSINRIVTYLPDNIVVRRARGRNLVGRINWDRPPRRKDNGSRGA